MGKRFICWDNECEVEPSEPGPEHTVEAGTALKAAQTFADRLWDADGRHDAAYEIGVREPSGGAWYYRVHVETKSRAELIREEPEESA